ncbi:hypothetical protein SEPCBS57363_005862 [Sporothrix epigloea]|uniref:Alpha-1,3-mannosyltransferase CMT1 n=1 Tax=Sporothrix epigloea TaxID=1892477 RepID=A0ABP0E144_9PEZI
MIRQPWHSRAPARHRVKAVIIISVACFVLVYRNLWYDISSPIPYTPWSTADYGGSWMKHSNNATTPTPTWHLQPISTGKEAHARTARLYTKLTLHQAAAPPDERYLRCPIINADRYRELVPRSDAPTRKYFFALDLRQVVDLLPTLMGSILEVLRFLGPHNCVVSIVEGRSTDGTYETLLMLGETIESMGAGFFLQRCALNPRVGDRIGKLAKLRNLALEPMHLPATNMGFDSTVLFINDIALCAEDLLELALQRQRQHASMACGMDYHRLGQWTGAQSGQVAFYDVWISRSMDGETFYKVPPGEGPRHAAELFPYDDIARARFTDKMPFQVFACWNGAVALDAQPFLEGNLEFRRSRKDTGECGAGEPTLLCKDLWHLGLGRILLVPSVSVAYSVDDGLDVKQARGYTSNWTSAATASEEIVTWDPHPPDVVRCIPSWRKQFWQAWDYGLERVQS